MSRRNLPIRLPPPPPSNPFDVIHQAHAKLSMFPRFIPPKIGPQLPMPPRPRLKPLILKASTMRVFVNTQEHVFQNQIKIATKTNPTLFDSITHSKRAMFRHHIKSSRVIPHVLRPITKMANPYWKAGFRLPAPSHFAFGARLPNKPIGLTVCEWRFRYLHPQFNNLFDKWHQPEVDLTNPKNIELLRSEIMIILESYRNHRQTKPSKLIRPQPLQVFQEYYRDFIFLPRIISEHRATKKGKKLDQATDLTPLDKLKKILGK